ncbi:glycosyltransferase [Saccharothrix sp. MB29]|nr:glycosyltransferase [Saccharothrix sp. MB29]
MVHAPWNARPVRPVLEAMACGVPVVAGAVGVLPDTVLDGVTGVLVPPRLPKALRLAVRRLLNDKTRRAAFSTAASDRVEQRHTWDRIATETAAVYRGCVEAEPSPRDAGTAPSAAGRRGRRCASRMWAVLAGNGIRPGLAERGARREWQVTGGGGRWRVP